MYILIILTLHVCLGVVLSSVIRVKNHLDGHFVGILFLALILNINTSLFFSKYFLCQQTFTVRLQHCQSLSVLLQPLAACVNPYPTAFPYRNGMVLHFYQQQESSTTKTAHKVINKGLKTYV